MPVSNGLAEAVTHHLDGPGHLALQHFLLIYMDSCIKILSDLVRVVNVCSERQVEEVNFVDFEKVPLPFWGVLHRDIEVNAANHAH